MIAIEIHKKLNALLASRSATRNSEFYNKALEILSELNEQRVLEGLPILTLPNIENHANER